MLEPLLTTVLYLPDMIKCNTTNYQSKGVSLRPLRQYLSYVLALLFVVAAFNPAQAGMAMRHQGVMADTLVTSDSTSPTVNVMDGIYHSAMFAGESSPKFVMANMNAVDHCQSECDCCPGLCSVYLPNNFTPSTFLTSIVALAESAFQGTVATRTSLFRPPIPH